MGQVTATTQATVAAPPQRVMAALADYATVRPRLLTGHYSEYEVREGGQGAGTIVHWKLAATSKRVRDCLVSVTVPDDSTLVETDANSSMVTTWKVSPAAQGSHVEVSTTWKGAGGVGGFFERTFAPRGLTRIYDEQLAKLPSVLED
ncbi:SRPBCC family protein [Spirillospora sp. NPDC050679]